MSGFFKVRLNLFSFFPSSKGLSRVIPSYDLLLQQVATYAIKQTDSEPWKLMQCCSISSGLVYFRAVSMSIYFLLKHSPSVSDYFTQNNSPNHRRANVNLQQLLLVVDRVLLKKMALAHCKCNMSCFFIALLCTEISLTADIARVIEKLPLLN